MAYQKKLWVNRQSEYPNRRGLRAVSGKENVYEIVREEGLVVEEGDPFDQASMNSLEERVEAGFAELVNGTVKAGKAVTADNATKAYGKAESSLSVSYAVSSGSAGSCSGNAATATRATTAGTADNATKAYGKAEGSLSVSYASSAGSCSGNAATATRATTAGTADNATRAYGKAEASLNVSYANSCGTASSANSASSASSAGYASSAGNADTVDGFHIAGKGTSAPGGLSENALYFVYE